MTHVDNPSHYSVSLCSGYGGLDIALGRVFPAVRPLAYVEIEAYACANLVQKMEAGLLPSAPVWTDLKTFPSAGLRGHVFAMVGGYPCQPFSLAGKRLGSADPRHLWPWIERHVDAIRPELCFFENVRGHVRNGLRDVRRSLDSLGYRTDAEICAASEVGAGHRRDRIFIIAHTDRIGRKECWDLRERLPDSSFRDRRNPQPRLGGRFHGVTHRVDRLRLAGNGVYPAQAEFALRTLLARIGH